MIPFDTILVPLSAALGLSLIVERVLELTKNILERLVRGADTPVIPDESEPDAKIAHLEQMHQRAARSEQVEKEAEAAADERKALVDELEKTQDPQKRKALREQLQSLEQDGEWDEKITGAEVLVHPATDPDDGWTMRTFILQILGFAVGIGVVHFSGLQLFNSFLSALESPVTIPVPIDYLFTGLLIGGGSAPMHVLVRFVTQRKMYQNVELDTSEKEEAPRMPGAQPDTGQAPKMPVRPKPPTDTGEIDSINVLYRGGVDREKLENVHVRPEDPNLIVYHHTAMHSDSSFQDVVRVIKSRADSQGNHWLTGYNCVILADGSIHPFCRWDRYGNHAVGYNRRSLGIAFNGNFETNPDVPGANPDGNLGRQHPTEEQIKAGARVITLWSYLYPIDLDFENSIIPHKQIASKACPGNGFFYDEMKRWVEFYKEKWETSEHIQQEMDAYKLKPYLYSQRRA